MASKRSKLLLAYFCSMLSLCVLNILFNTIPNKLSDNRLDMVYTLVSQLLCMGALPLCIALFVRRERGEAITDCSLRLLKDYRYFGKLSPKALLLLIPMVFSFYFVTQLVARVGMLILMLLKFEYPMSAGTIYMDSGDLIRMIALTALLPAIFEEFTHRGLLMDALSDKGSEASVIIVSGLMFALMHTNVIQFLYAFVGGCVFAYLVLRSKSIWPSMLLHFFNNTFSCISEYGAQHRGGIFGFTAEINDFFVQNFLTSLLYIILLVGNAALFVFLVTRFVRACPKREDNGSDMRVFRVQLPVSTQRNGGTPALADNVMLIATMVLCGAVTFFSYVWGVLR